MKKRPKGNAGRMPPQLPRVTDWRCSTPCTSERDYKDASAVAHGIGIELVRSMSRLVCRCPLLSPAHQS
jgi:hypothetical protein